MHHNLEFPLPELGLFDAVVSSFAIHNLTHERKRNLYQEIWDVLEPGGVFCNLEHVASPSPYAHQRFLQAMGITPAEEDPSNKLLNTHAQLDWLREHASLPWRMFKMLEQRADGDWHWPDKPWLPLAVSLMATRRR